MKYSDDCKVYRIRYYNVWFYLFAKTEMDEYKINILGERIGMGDSMMMKDIHCWCTRQNIRYGDDVFRRPFKTDQHGSYHSKLCAVGKELWKRRFQYYHR